MIWDDWGGFYDHATPPSLRADRLGPGLRIPFLLISPYSVGTNQVVHQAADYGSIMQWVEGLYGAPPLNSVDRNASSMAPFFTADPAATPRPFVPIASASANPYVRSMCANSATTIDD